MSLAQMLRRVSGEFDSAFRRSIPSCGVLFGACSLSFVLLSESPISLTGILRGLPRINL